jgi:uncharacterized metal-binding protein YceD (DUF177 family)
LQAFPQKTTVMKELKAYNINFAGLSEGEHKFDYQIDKKFLENFEQSLIQDAQVEVEVELHKKDRILNLFLKMQGSVPTTCDICDEDFDFAIDAAEEIIVKFVSEIPQDQAEAEILYLKHGETHVNVAMPIYEMLMLALPIRKTHPEDENGVPSCDPKILELLDDLQEIEEEEEEESSDNSIWAELKKLKDLDD